MSIAPILSYKVETIVIIVQTNERLNHQDEVCEIVCVLDLFAIISLNSHVFLEESEVLVNAMVKERYVVK
jgi:hypothetical protein